MNNSPTVEALSERELIPGLPVQLKAPVTINDKTYTSDDQLEIVKSRPYIEVQSSSGDKFPIMLGNLVRAK
jgi:hypothetical protein